MFKQFVVFLALEQAMSMKLQGLIMNSQYNGLKVAYTPDVMNSIYIDQAAGKKSFHIPIRIVSPGYDDAIFPVRLDTLKFEDDDNDILDDCMDVFRSFYLQSDWGLHDIPEIRRLALSLASAREGNGGDELQLIEGLVHQSRVDALEGEIDFEKYKAFALLMEETGRFQSIFTMTKQQKVNLVQSRNGAECTEIVIDILIHISVEELETSSNGRFVTDIAHLAFKNAQRDDDDRLPEQGRECLASIIKFLPETELGKRWHVTRLFNEYLMRQQRAPFEVMVDNDGTLLID